MTSTLWNGNSKGVEGLKQKCPLWGGGGVVGYFLELHNIITFILYMSNWKTSIIIKYYLVLRK